MEQDKLKDIDINEFKNNGDFRVNANITDVKLDIKLVHPSNNFFGISNQLILDNLGNVYILKPQGTNTLDNGAFSPPLNIEGLLVDINTVNDDKMLELDLEASSSDISDLNKCMDTPYGFKLSQVMNNIGDMSTLNITNGTNGDAQLTDTIIKTGARLIINQRAFSIIRGNTKYFLFNFNIKNVGEFIAQKVLFKDIIPNGLTLCNRGMYIKNNNSQMVRISRDNYTINGRELLLTLQNIDENDVVSLVLVCFENSCNDSKNFNVGCISYVSYYGVNDETNTTSSRTLVINDISNTKKIFG
ncbi:hypothetical protein [Candidatus Arthromitus sp. SFB-rat-Yit]|uniref:hypothetical protein n=1 Tax=Candidatus Arthromitus sp. SFB-rat-Yit TaxID=1041504 RepID=UPI000227A748|nr:hypothetical protein [Candidatus Arthromitus sp. SFB-rat-Yit]BAK80668.1 hypothetical protein RATSFB_0106 [Candidatus Arthromitus sp. SFB-rat-Yit]